MGAAGYEANVHTRAVMQRMRIAYRICPRAFFSANCFGDGLARLRALDGALEATYGTRVSLQKLEFHRFRVSGELRLQDSGISLLGEASAIAQVGAKVNTHSARARRRLHRGGASHIVGHQGAVPRRSRSGSLVDESDAPPVAADMPTTSRTQSGHN